MPHYQQDASAKERHRLRLLFIVHDFKLKAMSKAVNEIIRRGAATPGQPKAKPTQGDRQTKYFRGKYPTKTAEGSILNQGGNIIATGKLESPYDGLTHYITFTLPIKQA